MSNVMEKDIRRKIYVGIDGEDEMGLKWEEENRRGSSVYK